MSDLLTRLIEAGTPPALVAEVAMELARAEAAQEAIEARRGRDRERQRKHRNVTSRDVTDVTDETPSLSPSPSFPPNPQTNPAPMPTPVCASRVRGGFHRMPEGWRPEGSPPDALQAKLDCWPPGRLEDEIAAFKRWAANAPDQAGKGRKKDWDKALWNWLGRVHDDKFARQHRHPAQSGIGRTAAAIQSLGGWHDDRPM